MSTEPQELRKEIEDLKASQAARMATMGAAQVGTVRATVAGDVSFCRRHADGDHHREGRPAPAPLTCGPG